MERPQTRSHLWSVHTPGRRPWVVVAHGHPGVRQMLSVMLDEEGFDVTTTNVGREAVILLDTLTPEAVVADARLAYNSQEDIVSAMRRTLGDRNVPIVIFSPSDTLAGDMMPHTDWRILAREEGIDALIDLLVRVTDAVATQTSPITPAGLDRPCPDAA